MSSLLRVHVVLISATIALCLGYAAWEGTRADAHGAVRTAAGVGLPLIVAAGLGAYLVRLIRRTRAAGPGHPGGTR